MKQVIIVVMSMWMAFSMNAQIKEQSVVVECPGYSATELCDFAQEWFNTTNRDLLSTDRKLNWNNSMFIRMNNVNYNSGKVYGEVEYSFLRGMLQTYVVFFSLKIETKDGKIKFSMGNGRGYAITRDGKENVSLKSTDGDDEWALLKADVQQFFTSRIKTINNW
ncbi:MAG: DUF4468 domain-containing protein [Bacteroidales bacterium]|jgi:hypothetical protein|nr:DUF4468 domain-containing protein [Bacteroidales bacterium]